MARKILVPFGRLADYIGKMDKDAIGRTATRPDSMRLFADYEVKTWKTRAEMLEACAKSDADTLGQRAYNPWIKRSGN